MGRLPWWPIPVLLLLLALALRLEAAAVLACTALAAGGLSAWWGCHALDSVAYRRTLGASRLSPGEETTLTVEVTNAKALPLAWLLARDRFPREVYLLTDAVSIGAPGKERFLRTVTFAPAYGRVTRVHRIAAPRRGVYRFGPAELSSGDLLGLHEAHGDADGETTLTVYPRIVPPEALGLPGGRPPGEWFAPRSLVEDPLRYAAVRDYVPGDNPRHIHWKATARLRELQLKVFEPTDLPTIVVALDVRTAPEPHRAVPAYLEYAISAAGSLAVHALEGRCMVGLCANALGDRGATWLRLRPGRHPGQAAEILSALAGLEGAQGLPFEEMLLGLGSLAPRGAGVLAITAVPREGVCRALVELGRAGHPTLLCTVGDEAPHVPDAVAHHHLGGRDAWARLDTPPPA